MQILFISSLTGFSKMIEVLFALFVPPEPPELLMYTPEKSRKSLPLLLEGNLPYKRTRRQSGTQRWVIWSGRKSPHHQRIKTDRNKCPSSTARGQLLTFLQTPTQGPKPTRQTFYYRGHNSEPPHNGEEKLSPQSLFFIKYIS